MTAKYPRPGDRPYSQADQPAEPQSDAPHRRLSFVGTISAEPDFAERSEEILDDIVRRMAE